MVGWDGNSDELIVKSRYQLSQLKFNMFFKIKISFNWNYFGDVQGRAIHQRDESCIEAGKTIIYEECRNFDGTDTCCLTTIKPLKNSKGCIYRLVGTTFNITNRNQAELPLKEQTRLSAFRARLILQPKSDNLASK